MGVTGVSQPRRTSRTLTLPSPAASHRLAASAQGEEPANQWFNSYTPPHFGRGRLQPQAAAVVQCQSCGPRGPKRFIGRGKDSREGAGEEHATTQPVGEQRGQRSLGKRGRRDTGELPPHSSLRRVTSPQKTSTFPATRAALFLGSALPAPTSNLESQYGCGLQGACTQH
jgi:hypothetical protein